MRTAQIGLLLALLSAFVTSAASAATPVKVFDNSTTFTTGPNTPNGYWPFNIFLPGEPMGDQVTLAGSNRTVTRFDLLVSSYQPTVLQDLSISFYGYDAANDLPTEFIWQTSLSNISVNGPTIVSFDVPQVTVPDSFVWLASCDNNFAGWMTCDPPTIGSSTKDYWDLDPTGLGWFRLNLGPEQLGNFGATVWAVPEPATLTILCVGAIVAVCRRTSRH